MDAAEQIQAFGRELRRRRHARNMTLEVLGAAVGLTPNFIGAIELGKRDPSISTIMRLSRGLGATAGELLGTPELSADAIEAARVLSAIPPEVREPIASALRAVAAWTGKQP